MVSSSLLLLQTGLYTFFSWLTGLCQTTLSSQGWWDGCSAGCLAPYGVRGSRALCHSSLSGQGRLSVSESIIATKASAVSLSAKADAHIGRGYFFIWEKTREKVTSQGAEIPAVRGFHNARRTSRVITSGE